MQRRLNKFKKNLPLHLMLIPGVILLFIFAYVPMGGIVIAFQKFKPALGLFSPKQKWVGLGNFEFVLSLPNTMGVLRNTLVMAVGKIVLKTLFSIVFALLLNELRNKTYKRTVQTIVYFPHFLSWIILSTIFVDLLSPSTGIVNKLIYLLTGKTIFFLGDPTWFPLTMILLEVWKEFGFGTIIYLSAITGIDPTLYEAAAIDGAGRFKQTMNITLPGIQQTIILLAVLDLGNILNAGFDQVYNMYNSMVMETGDIIDTLVYRLGFSGGQYGPSTAVGLFKSAVSMVLIASTYYIAYRKFDYQIF
ncbi:MAG: ABC transporter permease [Aristaeellaceae bacterium]